MADVEHEAVEDAVAAEAVVEFVDREHLPHAEIMQTIELCIDLVLVAAVDFRQAAGLLHAAVEQMRNLDAEDDRHLAVVDHLARLGRCRSEEHTSELQSLMRISY